MTSMERMAVAWQATRAGGRAAAVPRATRRVLAGAARPHLVAARDPRPRRRRHRRDARHAHVRPRGPIGAGTAIAPASTLPVEVEIDGVRVRRCYSISSAPGASPRSSITVKRAPAGGCRAGCTSALRPGARASGSRPPPATSSCPMPLPPRAAARQRRQRHHPADVDGARARRRVTRSTTSCSYTTPRAATTSSFGRRSRRWRRATRGCG